MSDVNLSTRIHIWSYVYHVKWLLMVYNSWDHALFFLYWIVFYGKSYRWGFSLLWLPLCTNVCVILYMPSFTLLFTIFLW